MEEQQAIARLKAGDIGGLETLVRTHQVRAVRAAFLVTRDRALAESIVQEAFLRAYERIHQFEAGRPFGPWFLRGVVNDAIKAAQRRQRFVSLDAHAGESETPLLNLFADEESDPADLLEVAETRAAVWEALSRLSPTQRAAIVQRYYLDMSEAEMAEEAESPPGTIKWRLHAARKRLRTLLHPLRTVPSTTDEHEKVR